LPRSYKHRLKPVPNWCNNKGLMNINSQIQSVPC